MIYITPKFGKTWQGKPVSLLPHPLTRGFFNVRSCDRKPINKVAHKTPKVPPFVCIISLCLILILLSILRFLTQSYVRQPRMRIQSLKPLTNVGVYALHYPKNTGIPKCGMENASWVNIETGSNARARSKKLDRKFRPESS